jgi:phosphatidylinositol alpha-1,6-mannosyltransferase
VGVRVLHIGTDSFGGYGGIALYNRELIAAIAAHASVDEVVVVPRIIGSEREPLPEKVTFVSAAARGRLAFLRALRAAGSDFDLVICAHVNLLPVARLVTKRPLLMLYGIEAWKTFRDPISKRLLHGIRGIVSISDITRERFIGWSHYDGPS